MSTPSMPAVPVPRVADAAHAPRRGQRLTVGRSVVAAAPLLASIAFVAFAQGLAGDVALSFVVLGLAVSLHALFAISGRARTAADASVFSFVLMFLLVAPIVQVLVLGLRLVNTTHATPDLLIQTNLVCSLFVGVFLLGRLWLFRSSPPMPGEAAHVPAPPAMGLFALAALAALCGFITLVSVPFMGASAADQSVAPVLLAFRKFLFFIPTAVFLTLLAEAKAGTRRNAFVHLLLLALLFGCVLVTQNTLTEKRNALGPVYLAALFLLFRGHLQRKGVQVAWLIFVLLLLFPAVALFNQVPLAYLDEVEISWRLWSNHFLETHYDAWANIYTTLEMGQRDGLAGGRQLLGALLFFVPSQWWGDKPLATGIEIGNFLMTWYQMWFTNLSAPLVAEGYLDFGVLGVVAYALGLAALVQRIEGWAAPGRAPLVQAVAVYLAFFLVFLMRGSLMIAVAYGGGALVAFLACRWLLALTRVGAVRRR
jgi:hypothetical protein